MITNFSFVVAVIKFDFYFVFNGFRKETEMLLNDI